MLPAHVCKKLGSGPGVASFHIFMSLANPFNGFREILAFPLQIGCKSVIQGYGGIRAAPPGVFFQLCLTFRFEW